MIIPFRIPPDSARAYGGSAHQSTWRVSAQCDAPSLVLVDERAYRLVRSPRSGRPVVDRLGNYVYVPQGLSA